MLIYKFFIPVCSVLFVSCDLDKFTGYKYEVDPIPVQATLYGTISNIYTGTPIYRAMIRTASDTAITNEEGKYLLAYQLTADNLRDKPLVVFITADKYHELDSAVVIYPQTMLNACLVYGAPFIKKATLIDTICQVIVFDYQGATDIAAVKAEFFYRRPGERQLSLKIEKYLDRVNIDSTYYGWYQTRVDTSLEGYGNITNSYHLQATDKDSFSDSTSSSAVGVDTLLFLPLYK